ncbi:MAG: DUF4411 family protein [Proteobacteria bacterium]|nr:DUF4411 family protein [Pseudomonadota bacterium]
MHLLDANVLITAHNSYYAIDQVPQFWAWLRQMGDAGHVKMPAEIFDEIKDGGTDEESDLLYEWISEPANKLALLLNEEPDATLVQQVIEQGYGNDLTDDQLEEIGRDPILIAYGLKDPTNRWIVTTEVSAPSKKKQNRKIPDVCNDFSILWCGPFVMTKKLGFKAG